MTGVDYGDAEFTVRRFQLAQLADWAMAAVPSGRTALPVHGCFKVTVTAEQLVVAATDQQLTVFADTPSVRVPGGQGETTVFLPAKKLKAILTEAPEGDITVRVQKNFATVSAQGAKWSLKLSAGDQYAELPDLDQAEWAETDREKFLAALRTVRHAAGRDLGRPAYAQVAIEKSGDGVHVTASDSSQFARAPLPDFPFTACIPSVALDHLPKLMGGSPVNMLKVADLGGVLAFSAGPVTLAVGKITVKWPDMDKLMLLPARQNDRPLSVDKAELVAAIRRVRINANADTSAIVLVLADGSVTVTSQDENDNRASETVRATWASGSQRVVVNWQFLDAALNVYPSAQCTFRAGKDQGKKRAPLLLEDAGAGISVVIPQMTGISAGRST
jgi:DNA polymerase III sliding clamp (beta) subunit (PCNA family)